MQQKCSIAATAALSGLVLVVADPEDALVVSGLLRFMRIVAHAEDPLIVADWVMHVVAHARQAFLVAHFDVLLSVRTIRARRAEKVAPRGKCVARREGETEPGEKQEGGEGLHARMGANRFATSKCKLQ